MLPVSILNFRLGVQESGLSTDSETLRSLHTHFCDDGPHCHQGASDCLYINKATVAYQAKTVGWNHYLIQQQSLAASKTVPLVLVLHFVPLASTAVFSATSSSRRRVFWDQEPSVTVPHK